MESNSTGVNIVKTEYCLNHIHILVQIALHLNISSFMGYLKHKSSLMLTDM